MSVVSAAPPRAGDCTGAAMRVLMTTPDLEKVGGVSNYLKVCRPYHATGVEYVTRGSRPGERGRFSTAWRALSDVVRLGWRVSRGGHDLVHQNTSFARKGLARDAVGLLLARLARKPVVVFFHGWDRELADGMRGPWLWFLRLTYFQAESIVVLATEFRDYLRAWGYRGRVYVETTVVDDEYAPAAVADGADGDSVQILFMARLERGKGAIVAINAAERLVRGGARLRLVIAGDGRGRQEAERYVRDRGLDFVSFEGFVVGNAKLSLLQRSDIYLFPTQHGEGMPTTVLEAMACGLPVITRPVGGVRDFFEDGRMGALTDSIHPSAFALLLEPFVSDAEHRERVGAYNARYARQRFVASRVVPRLEAIYRATCETRT